MRYFHLLALMLITNFMYAQLFKVGDKVDMYGTDGNYYAASVKEVSGDKYKIHFDAYDAANDKWVEAGNLVRGGKPGDKIIVVASQGTFYGTIQQVDNINYKVKYDGYPDTYTLLRSQFSFVTPATNSPSLAIATTPQVSQSQVKTAPATNGFGIGSKVNALQGSTWYAATIKEIKEGKYLVKYDDYNEEEWVTIERLRAKPTLSTDKLKSTAGKTYIRSIRWIATGYTELSWYFLGDNGVIVVNPVHGSNPINFALEQTDNNKNVGTYTISNNQIIIKWLSGNSTTYSLTYRNGEIIEMDAGGIMVRQKGLAENYKISGTYKGSISFGNVSSGSTFTFTKDGSVTATRTGTTSTPDASGRSSNIKSGKYQIKGNTLVVTYNDGTKETANIGMFDGAPSQMVLNSSWMTAQ